VHGHLYLSNCAGLKTLPDGLVVGGFLDLSGCTGLQLLPDGLKVGGDLDLYGCAASRRCLLASPSAGASTSQNVST
jgi:hypothetical protein